MSWAFGFDGGRPVGYGVLATCDKRGCDAEIDRGLAYRCGPGELGDGCGGFYCPDHLGFIGARGGCPHRWPKRQWGRTLSCMAERTVRGATADVCLYPLGHDGDHAWADNEAHRGRASMGLCTAARKTGTLPLTLPADSDTVSASVTKTKGDAG